MKETRQQRRENKRNFNKKIQKEGRSLLARRLLDPEKKSEFEEYTPSSHSTAVMPFCIVFNEENDLNDYAFCCREGAEAILDSDQPKFIILIKEPGIELPAPKQVLMKIGTRIFNKKAPNRVYIFLEVEGNPKEDLDISGAIGFFLARLGAVPEGAPRPEWLSEYIYREESEK